MAKLFNLDDTDNNIKINNKIKVKVLKKDELYICELRTHITNYQFYDQGLIIFDKKNMFINELSTNAITFLKRLLENDITIKKEEIYNFEKIIVSALKNDFNFELEIDNNEIEVADIEVKIDYQDDTTTIDIDYDNNLIVDEKKIVTINSVLAPYDTIHGYRITDIDATFDFINTKLEVIYDNADQVLISESFKKLSLVNKYSVSVNAKITKTSLQLELLSTHFEANELGGILSAYKAKKKYFKLKNGQYLSLNNKELEKVDELMSGLNIKVEDFKNNQIKMQKYRGLYLEEKTKELNLKLEKNKAFEKMVTDFEELNNHDFTIPKTIDATLRTYQEEGFNWLKHLEHYSFGGILADDMGLGKTLQVITLLASIDNKIPSIVICPSSLIINWGKELDKFAPSIKYLLLNQGKNERQELVKTINEYDIVITSYDVLKRDITVLEENEFDYIILDEAQYIKNQNTQVAKAVKLLNGEQKLVLTGTPIENSLSELWSIFDFLMPGYLLTYPQFSKKYEKPIIKEGSLIMLKELREIVAPFILRRLKQDVLTELPDKTETIIYAEMEKKQRKVYDALVLELKNSLESKDEKELNSSKLEILSVLTKLRQVCCNPGLVFENYDGSSAKYDVILELVSELRDSKHKTILFSQFTSNFEHLKQLFDVNNITYCELTGKTNKNKRQQMVEDFNNDDTNIFLISLKAGGTGLNITGADTVIHLDPWWNVAAENQATDRAHRMGQKKNVTVYKIIAQDTLEEKIINMQKDKKEIANSILENNEVSLKKMSKDDILNIITKPNNL